jgi:methyl-accepting chemotaxis protein
LHYIKGNDDLSQRTQEQASSLEETAASMEEMTASVKQNSVNATHAAKLVKGSLVQAESGKLVVTRTTEAMMDIYTASQRIEEIITLMDEIAFQTNLLALNAAVEAAHAGDHGRGFGVVAIEVRNLAQRSKNASHEIKGLIRTSSEKVEAGQLLVNESGQALKDIFESINKVSDLVDDIAAASSEQSTGINQITMAISQIDEVTQQNAALVEEAASASRAMQEQAAELMHQVGFFDVTKSFPENPQTIEPVLKLLKRNESTMHPVVA